MSSNVIYLVGYIVVALSAFAILVKVVGHEWYFGDMMFAALAWPAVCLFGIGYLMSLPVIGFFQVFYWLLTRNSK